MALLGKTLKGRSTKVKLKLKLLNIISLEVHKQHQKIFKSKKFIKHKKKLSNIKKNLNYVKTH